MQVNFNTQNYSHSTSFSSLKDVKGGKLLSHLIGDDGYVIVERLRTRLEANSSFNTLCKKYDVFVNVKPHILGSSGILLEKGLSLEILARKISKGGFLNIFKKKPPKETVSRYMAAGIEAKTWDLADYITKNFINNKDGMTADIYKYIDNACK